jgi:hypothetical protein
MFDGCAKSNVGVIDHEICVSVERGVATLLNEMRDALRDFN